MKIRKLVEDDSRDAEGQRHGESLLDQLPCGFIGEFVGLHAQAQPVMHQPAPVAPGQGLIEAEVRLELAAVFRGNDDG